MVKKKKISENLHKRYKEGCAVRDTIDKSKRLTGGLMFKASHIVLDKEILKVLVGTDFEWLYDLL